MYQNAIGVVLVILLMLIFALSVIHNFMTKQNFTVLCSLFVDKFGVKPTEVLIYQHSGVFFSFMRDSFFIKALYFKENTFHTRGMDIEQVRFIKSLPPNYTNWLRIKVRFSVIGCVLFFMIIANFYLSPLLIK
jgi:hypothetical protein